MEVMKVVIIVILGLACHSVAAQEKVCSSFCSSFGLLQTNPGKSCDDIYQINKASRGVSGNYWINTTTDVHQVYCDMELECGGHKGGWMRIANLDTSRGDDCPSGWTKITTNDAGQPSIDVCRTPSDNGGCNPTIFTVNGTSYHKICGKARGYQKFSTEGFASPSKSINGPYVDGLSITLDNPRKHIWTYAVGFSEASDNLGNCPCAANPGVTPLGPHPFINNDYHCESGSPGVNFPPNIFITNDPLWDGSGCVETNTNCCSNVNLPWFYRQFPVARQDDIEARICTDAIFDNEAVAIDQLYLFVQ